VRDRAFRSRARAIRLLAVDVDGVLTDGRLCYGPGGEETKRFHVHDGLALAAARAAGLAVAVVSSRASVAVSRRMAELGISLVHQGEADKLRALERILAQTGVAWREAAFMGDDLPDLPALARVGLALAPASAVPEVRRRVHWVSRRRGGEGAVREAVEMILKARSAWPPRSAGF
jgi:3-deoxy-D-manno-octulosonate 8-phosphate phosphatase (KDO 8-P phosphatase)